MTIPLPHTVIGPLAIALGAGLQAAQAVLRRPRPGDGRRLAIALGVSLLGFVPARVKAGSTEYGEPGYSRQLHLYLVVAAFAMGIAWQFRERIVPRIGARLLLAWSLLTLSALWSLEGHAGPWLLVALLGTAVAVANAFTDLDRTFGWQVFLFAWYCASLVLLVVVEWHATSWTGLSGFVAALNTRTIAGNFFAGAALFYVAANAWFVLALVPVPLFKGQSFDDRWSQIRRHMDLLAWGYVWEPEHRMRSVAVLVALPLALIANAYWQVVDPSRLVVAAIALMPLVANAQSLPGHDGVGALPGDDPELAHAIPDARPTGPTARRRRALARLAARREQTERGSAPSEESPS